MTAAMIILGGIIGCLLVVRVIMSGKNFSLPKLNIGKARFSPKIIIKIAIYAVLIMIAFRIGLPQHGYRWLRGETDSSLNQDIKLAQKERELNEIKIWAERNIADGIFDTKGNIDKNVLINLGTEKDEGILELNRRLENWRRKFLGSSWSKPTVPQQAMKPPTKIPTATKPKPQEKWVFGFRAEFEQVALAAKRNTNQSFGDEDYVTMIKASERELEFSYIVDKKTRHARLALDEHGYFSGVVDKEKTRKLRIWLAEDKNSPKNYVGYMQDWDAKYPGKKYPIFAAYLRRK
ncbi:MAG: hypothetical protein Q8Q21_01735 [bacterium]|nr:hypothetical protein [bacterium]